MTRLSADIVAGLVWTGWQPWRHPITRLVRSATLDRFGLPFRSLALQGWL